MVSVCATDHVAVQKKLGLLRLTRYVGGRTDTVGVFLMLRK
jgi:hypothetical protein